MTVFPTRFVHRDAARKRFGDRVDRFGAYLMEGDPLADAAVDALRAFPRPQRDAWVDAVLRHGPDGAQEAPEALRALAAAAWSVPLWVDFDRADRGGAAFLRGGILGGIVLGSGSLIAGYCSPAGNKPLMFSGRLESDVPRRLAETSRFVEVVSQPGGMRPGAAGFVATGKVRLIHAAVRRMLQQHPGWNTPAWGVPINQADMVGTSLLFSLVVLDGMAKLGFDTTPTEREDLLHLWRYNAHVIGVDAGLTFATEAEARTLWDLLSSTQSPPDDDARALARALIESGERAPPRPNDYTRPLRARAVGYALSRYLIGDGYADHLGYPRSALGDRAIRAFRDANARAWKVLRAAPTLPLATPEAGARYWRAITAQALAGVEASFAMPDALANAPPAP
jgi:hypothetical protein